jgi:hypothetical protein
MRCRSQLRKQIQGLMAHPGEKSTTQKVSLTLVPTSTLFFVEPSINARRRGFLLQDLKPGPPSRFPIQKRICSRPFPLFVHYEGWYLVEPCPSIPPLPNRERHHPGNCVLNGSCQRLGRDNRPHPDWLRAVSVGWRSNWEGHAGDLGTLTALPKSNCPASNFIPQKTSKHRCKPPPASTLCTLSTSH